MRNRFGPATSCTPDFLALEGHSRVVLESELLKKCTFVHFSLLQNRVFRDFVLYGLWSVSVLYGVCGVKQMESRVRKNSGDNYRSDDNRSDSSSNQ